MDDFVLLTGKRTSGLLLHPTSLPGRYGIGDLGTAAYQFVDFLVASGQQCWQVLPLGPPDEAHSPYQGASSIAGNTLVMSLETLVTEGWRPRATLDNAPAFPATFVDYGAVSGRPKAEARNERKLEGVSCSGVLGEQPTRLRILSCKRDGLLAKVREPLLGLTADQHVCYKSRTGDAEERAPVPGGRRETRAWIWPARLPW